MYSGKLRRVHLYAIGRLGITIDTIPVISLGIGLGVDYGIYAVSRICDECAEGRRLEDAITTALRGHRGCRAQRPSP